MGITSVRLQPELEEKLATAAGNLHRSKSWIINQAVREFLEKQQLEQQRWQETLDAIASVERGDTVSASAVHAWVAGELTMNCRYPRQGNEHRVFA